MDEKKMPQEPQQPEAAPVQPASEPMAEPAVQPVAQPVTEPVAEPVAQPAMEPAAQPAADAAQPQQPEAFAAPAMPTQPYGAQPQQPAQPYGAQPQPGQQPAMPQQPYGAQPQPMYGQPAQYQGSSKATPALVCGVLGLVLVLLGFVLPFSGIIGLVLSIVGIVMAAKNKKNFGKDSKATAGKVCGIIGIVAWVVSFIIGIVLGAMLIGGLAGNPGLVDDPARTPAPDEPSAAAPSDGVEATAAFDAITARLDALAAGDAAELETIAAMVEEDFYEETEFHLSDIGVDAMEYARWMAESVTYEDLDVTEYGDEGLASVTIKAYDVFDFLATFNGKAGDYVDRPEFETSSYEEDMAALGAMFRESMEETTGKLENYALFDLEKVGDTWVVTEDSWEDELDYMFGLA